MTEELGRGPYLDELLDFEVDPTGDIRATPDGSEELQKDLAFQMIIALDDTEGLPATANTRAKIKSRARAVALSDVRIDSVDIENTTVQEVDIDEPGAARFRIVLPVVASDEEQELVFEV